MADKILYKNKFLTLVDRDGWVFVKNMTEVAIAVLPFRSNGDTTEFLARIEPIPCHKPPNHLCALTGSVEKGEKPEEAAYRELYEEAGYKTDTGLISLGKIYTSKASSTEMHLYSLDVSGLIQQEAPGDGTKTEAESTTRWLSRKKATMTVPDATFGAMLARLSLWLSEELGVW